MVIREWRTSDAELYLTLSNDIGYTAFSTPGQFAAKNESEALRQIQQRSALFDSRGLGKFPLFLKSGDELIGTCGLDPYTLDGHNEVELGYRLFLKHWGKGYATEAAAAVLKYGFDQLKLSRVVAFAIEQNSRSLKVMERLGFRFLKVFDQAGLRHKLYEVNSSDASSLQPAPPDTGFVRYAILLNRIPNTETSPDTIRRHIQHLRKLDGAGQLVLSGPFTDHASGMVVVRAKDKNEAVSIALADPFVIEGARTFEVRSWLLACSENNYLG